MNHGYAMIRTVLVFGVRTVGGGAASLRADLTYDSREPYAVTLTLHTGRGPVDWLAARDLLADGLREPVGLGDVRVAPDGERPVTLIELSSPSGYVSLEADTGELVDFLYRTYDEVPRGEESRSIDLDAELAELTRPPS